MSSRIACRIVLVVFTAVLCLAAVTKEKEERPEGWWESMSEPPNESYDWLRPPDRVLESMIGKAYSGDLPSDFYYKYTCGESFGGCYKKLNFGYGSGIYKLHLNTPMTLAVRLAQKAREKFEPRPSMQEIAQLRKIFRVTLFCQSLRSGDTPNLALFHEDEYIRPASVDKEGYDVSGCELWEDQACWDNVADFVFEVSDDKQLSGVGQLVLRWGSGEAKIPVNFDYLW